MDVRTEPGLRIDREVPRKQLMRALVTGSNGFIGRTLVRRASDSNWRVRAATRTPAPEIECPEHVVTGDIDGSTDWAATLDGVDVVFHLAGIAHVLGSKQGTPSYDETNAAATAALARAAIAAGVRRFVYVSTAKVAGEISTAPFRESDPPNPSGPYAVSKKRGEDLLQECARGSGMEVSIVRPPLVYGPGVRANFLTLMRAVERGIPLPVGAVHNLRSYVGVRNLADALLFVATSPRAANETVFVSDGKDLSTPELIARIAAALERPARLIRVPLPLIALGAAMIGNRQAVVKATGSFQVDISRIRGFGWEAPFSMDEELETTVEWFRRTK